MKYLKFTFLLLLSSNLALSQVAKVKLEEGVDQIKKDVSNLEALKVELTAYQRDFNAAKKLLTEFHDLQFKAMETGKVEYHNQSILKLKESKSMIGSAYVKWKAYHEINNKFKSYYEENTYKDVIKRIDDYLARANSFKTTCCGNDIVELHLIPQNIVYEKLEVNTRSSKNKDFWIFGENETKVSGSFIINKKPINLNDYEYTIYSEASFTRWGNNVEPSTLVIRKSAHRSGDMILGFTKKGMSTEDLLDKYNSEHSNWEEYMKEWRRGIDAYNNKKNNADFSYKLSIAKELPEAIDNMTDALKVYRSRKLEGAPYDINWVISNAHDYSVFKLTILPFNEIYWHIKTSNFRYSSPWEHFDEFTESGVNTNIQIFALGLRAMNCTGDPYDYFSLDDDENKDLSKQITQVYNYFLNNKDKNTFLEYYIKYNKTIYGDKLLCEECLKRRFALSLTYQLYLDCYN